MGLPCLKRGCLKKKNLSCEKLNFENATRLTSGIRERTALQTQNSFRTITAAAAAKGMRVINDKTKVLVVSDAMSYSPRAIFVDNDGLKLSNDVNGGELKVLGFHIGSTPGMHAHVESIRRKIRARFWVLRHLKTFGLTENQLVEVYKSCIRPIADYCAVVYHSALTNEQDEVLERLQSHALKCIFGPGISGGKMRAQAEITTLRQRRIVLCDKFAQKVPALTTGSRPGPAPRTPRAETNTWSPMLGVIGLEILLYTICAAASTGRRVELMGLGTGPIGRHRKGWIAELCVCVGLTLTCPYECAEAVSEDWIEEQLRLARIPLVCAEAGFGD